MTAQTRAAGAKPLVARAIAIGRLLTTDHEWHIHYCVTYTGACAATMLTVRLFVSALNPDGRLAGSATFTCVIPAISPGAETTAWGGLLP
ncbi:MAG: hypothetical protein JWO80_3900 [Bryobacterales bacterium]|nr:hypothetical protein [Bryobacterales bacterium]